AFERLAARAAQVPEAAAQPQRFNSATRFGGAVAATPKAPPARRSDSLGEAFAKSFVRQLGNAASRAIVRGVLGSILR
ncbi:MAG: DUF853 family protein, partial [Paracoccaceae bacterium]|nr:DUF853 family protein [Paracoccaceae bacterium]